jgi:hypothetical protein
MYDKNGTSAVWYTIHPLSSFIQGTIINMPEGVAYPVYEYFPSYNYTNLTNYFVMLGAKYIVLNKQAYPGPGVPLGNAGGYPWNFTKFEDALSRLPNVSLVIQNSYYNVYKINLNTQLIYPSEGIVGNLSYDKLFLLFANGFITAQKQSIIYGYNAINISDINGVSIHVISHVFNVEYKIKVSSPHKFYLVFDEGYSPKWILLINGSVIDVNHYIANGYANAWLMPAGNYTAVVTLSSAFTIHLLWIIVFVAPLIMIVLYALQRFRGRL